MECRCRLTPHLGLPDLAIAVLLALQIVAPAPPLAYALAVLVGAVAIGYYGSSSLQGRIAPPYSASGAAPPPPASPPL